MRARGQLRLGLAAAALLLAGCGSMIYGPTSGQRKQAQQQKEQAASGSAGSQAQAQTQQAQSSSKAPPAKRSELDPAVIDILTVFQDKLRDKSDGYDVKDVAGSSQGVGQLMLVTKGFKLNRSPQQDRILYVISGRGDISLDGSGTSVRAGHIIVVPLGVTFSIVPSGEQPLRLLVLKSPGNGHNALEWVKDSPAGESGGDGQESSPPPEDTPASAASSEEVFQTGTLAPNDAPEVGADASQSALEGVQQ